MSKTFSQLTARVKSTGLHYLTEYRGIVILLVVLPLSFLFEAYFTIRNFIFQKLHAAPLLHDARVKDIQAQVRRWKESGTKKMMCTARRPWLTMSTRTADFKDSCNAIKVELRDILNVDTENMIVRTEPLVDMGYMTRHLLPMGYQLAIQVEMEDLTIGGLCMGLGMETNSHHLGLIQETVMAFEVVLADGRLVRATRENEFRDLFYALSWSHGTLGFLVAVELKILPVKSHMHMTYIPCHSQEEYCRRMQELSVLEGPDAPSFLEATIYSKDKAVIMVGEFAEVKTWSQWLKVNSVNYYFKEWYYIHVERFLTKSKDDVFDEYIPLRHYHHRFTRSIFWELRDLITFGNHPLYRWTLGWLGAPKVSFLKLTMTPQIRREVVYKHVVQDIIIPISEMSNSVDKFHDWFEIYPLLVFPIRIVDHKMGAQGFLRPPKNLQPGTNYEMFFDLGAYGVPERVREKKPWDAHQAVREMEEYTREVGGYQCLYADTFMTREEFREMFDHTLYDRMRVKYNAIGAFPEVYDKIKPERGLIDFCNKRSAAAGGAGGKKKN